ncbi:3-deoxy-manno-octulosonate cytidylyltransferase [Novosphingobium sp. M1R2S20]|uniref:3-deoxy-manno-octulosonate cytidylyltransferase n=1 Tax=Novosphingobium rhizovicinum TaxID=3228928 RepID=A0ABV3R6Y3_9SPHN
MLDELIVIPARYNSTRLPGKPLIQIGGLPMIVQTHARCLEALPRDQIVVATDDDRIAEVCRTNDIRCEMTASDHPTGGDRVAEVAQRIAAKTYINVQGDEPVCNPADIRLLIDAAREHRDRTIIGYCDLSGEAEWRDPNCCKLLFGRGGALIYIGRAPVPATRSGEFSIGYRQICLHAYPGEALAAFARVGGKSELEAIEDHEMLRFLELGRTVHVIRMSNQSIPVDRPGDVARAEAVLARMKAPKAV